MSVPFLFEIFCFVLSQCLCLCKSLCLHLCLAIVFAEVFVKVFAFVSTSVYCSKCNNQTEKYVGWSPPVPAQCAQCPSLPAGNHCLWRCTTNFWPPPDNIEALFSLTLSSTQDYLPHLKGFLSPSVSLCITKIRAGSLEGT